jgi:hypothetical protein
MYARVASFESDPSDVDDAIEMRTALANGQRSPRKLLMKVAARPLGRKP